MIAEQRLSALGYQLPERSGPARKFVPAVRVGDIVFVGGHGPLLNGVFQHNGKLGDTVTTSQGEEAARLAVVNCLSSVREVLGELDSIARIVKVFGMLNATPAFTDHGTVMNAASELLLAVFGERGAHCRAAVGMASLPNGISVEAEMIVEVDSTAQPRDDA